MVAEAAALRLGSTVARAAAHWWLGGGEREQQRHLSMQELIRLKVSGLRLQRGVGQQFEQITDAVFDRLEPHLRHAFQHLDEGGREAVLAAVTDTFEQADLSDDALMAANVSSAEFVRRIKASTNPPVGLGDAESRLYDTLFTECAEYYVRIVRTLPVFEERAASELLARTATLGQEISRILERLPDRSLFAPDGTDLDAHFGRTYMDLVSRELDEVELFRTAAGRAAPSPVRLSVAYVSLRATGDDGRRRRTGRPAVPLRPDLSLWEDEGGDGAGRRVESALSGPRRVLLRGEAGSGKTTLLRWLAVTAARGAFRGELAEWNGLTPILVKLREYSGRRLPGPGAMLDGVADPITGIMPPGWVERRLADDSVLLLIDGVDELLDRERRGVREWLRGLLGAYPGLRLVVTSRPAAAGADWLRREEFTALQLDRMTPADLAAFVRQWHQAVRELGDELPCPPEELPQYEQSLLTSLQDRAHLQSLAGTPLLAAMLCAMHLNHGRQLPRDRMELYRNALHTLVHDRDADRNVPSAVDSKLGLGDKMLILRDLAWRLSDNNRSEADLDRAAEYVTAKLRAMRHLDVLDGGRVLEQLRQRSGILRSPAQGRVDFVHRTFQEYLAAQEAAAEDRIGNLVERAHLDLWRETIIMTAGHATTRQREELLGGILDRAESEPRHARTLRLLAAACQETLPEVSNGLAERLGAAVAKLLPARRPTDPPALAAVGPNLLRQLPRSLGELTGNAAVQTIRTAALIGGEEALELLAGYVGDERWEVVAAFADAWAYFDAGAYADRVLSRVPLAGQTVPIMHSGQLAAVGRLGSLTGIDVQMPVQSLDFLAGLPPLRTVWIRDLRDKADLSILRGHPDLRDILLYGAGAVTGTRILGEFGGLKALSLTLRHTDLELEMLGGIPRLESLSLSAVGDTHLAPLATLSRLRYLSISNTRCCVGIDDLAGLACLTSLNFYHCEVEGWLPALTSGPPGLTVLTLMRCTVPTDPRAFRTFERLETLYLRGCRAPGGAPITSLDVPGVRTIID